MSLPSEKRTGRRRIAVACNECRDRKSRCDGVKPTCSTCLRRGYSASRCIYQVQNTRTASGEAYIASLHDRIHRLEQQANSAAEIMPSVSTDVHSQSTSTSSPPHNVENTTLRDQVSDVDHSAAMATARGIQSSSHFGSQPDHEIMTAVFPTSPQTCPYVPYESTEPASSVTGMGDIASPIVQDSTREPGSEYFGSSSTASLMRIASDRISHSEVLPSAEPKEPRVKDSCAAAPFFGRTTNRELSSHPVFRPTVGAHACLPPRQMADELLMRYWDKVHSLFPFVHRPSFQVAYERLWQSSREQRPPAEDLDVGLGGSQDSGPYSPAFHAALNVMFALACHHTDMNPTESGNMAHKFFVRSKEFVGLDFLDGNNLGVVQALLIRGLYLQSTPFPNRCWISVGVAFRIAQGLGLHTDCSKSSSSAWEVEMRRRVWHGCVLLDRVVCMTFGRPRMSSHAFCVPYPSAVVDDKNIVSDAALEAVDTNVSRSSFYISAIELGQISEKILAKIHQPWLAASNQSTGDEPISRKRYGSFDTMMDLESALADFESALPGSLSWLQSEERIRTTGCDNQRKSLRERNVLHAMFLHLKLMLYRPMLTETCHTRHHDSNMNSETGLRSDSYSNNMIYSEFATRCARSCVTVAMKLLELVHGCYLSQNTSAWWYNGLYASTAGLILTLARSCPRILDGLDVSQLQQSFGSCEDVLAHLATFNVSAHNSLIMLRNMNRKLDAQQTRLSFGRGVCDDTIPSTNENTSFSQSMGNKTAMEEMPSLPVIDLDELSAMDNSFFTWDPAVELMPDELYAALSNPVTPPSWMSATC